MGLGQKKAVAPVMARKRQVDDNRIVAVV